MAKNVKKMQKSMRENGYHYCTKHDVYYDEWLKCPACLLEDLMKTLSDVARAVSSLNNEVEEVIAEFNPKDRE
ncbi:MAG TPA: hypothetical protein VMZ91_05175 [Candidatus Paceibacterota bacterium]|nr:hypothetical protein [Candidatus Paceibacterota bacterium]